MYPETYNQSAFPSLEATMLFGQYGFGTLCMPREAACVDRYRTVRPNRRKNPVCLCQHGFAACFFGRPKCL